jgi:hypothetical protein
MATTNPILPPEQQTGRAEKNVARLLYNLGLIEYLMEDEEFYVRLENKPYIPLGIELHGEFLHFLHVLSSNGDAYIDSEMIFRVSPDGMLSLYETAAWAGYFEARGFDRAYSSMFSRNLLEQGFDKPDKPSKDPLEMSKWEFEFYWNRVWDDTDAPKKLGRYGLVKEALISGKRIPSHFQEVFADLITQSEAPVPPGIRMIFVHPLRRQAKSGSPDEGKMVSSFEIIPDEGNERFTVEAPDRETAISRALDHLKETLIERVGSSLQELNEMGLDEELLSIIKNGSLQTATIDSRFFDAGCRVSLQQERLASLDLIYPHSFSLTPSGVAVVQAIQGIDTPAPSPDSATSYRPGMKVLIVGDLGRGVTIEIDSVEPYTFCRSNQRIHGTDEGGKSYWTTGDQVRYVAPRTREKIFEAFVEGLCSQEISRAIVSSNDDSEMAQQLLKRLVRDMLMELAVSRPSIASADEYHTIGQTINEVEEFIVEVVAEAETRIRSKMEELAA